MTVARFDTNEQFWMDWYNNWFLYGTVYAINTPEPRIVTAKTLTIHEGPCPREVEAMEAMVHALEAVNAALNKASYGDSVESDLLEAYATLDSAILDARVQP